MWVVKIQCRWSPDKYWVKGHLPFVENKEDAHQFDSFDKAKRVANEFNNATVMISDINTFDINLMEDEEDLNV